MTQRQAAGPYFPFRTAGWPARRTPPRVRLTVAVLLAIAVAVGIAHRPTPGQRATDLRGVLAAMTAGIQSCAGGVSESLTVLRAIQSGASRDYPTALTVARTGAANCSPANNQLLADLVTYQAPESLHRFHLEAAVTALINWAAPAAATVQSDVAAVLAASDGGARTAAEASLRRALHMLDERRAAVYAALEPAIKSLSPQSSPPALPG